MRIWYLISHHWRLIGGFVLLGLVAGVVVALSITPIYRAEAVLTSAPGMGQVSGVEGFGGQLGGVAGLLGLGRLEQSRKQEYLAALRSRVLTHRFILEKNLIPIIFEDRYETADGTPKLKEGAREPSIEEAYQRFDRRIRHISESSQTGLITVAIDWRDPVIAARWANDLVMLANSELRKQEIEIGQKSISFLNQELEKTNVIELRQVIYGLIEEQIQNIMIANVREEYAFRVIDPAGVRDMSDRHSPNRSLIVFVFLSLSSMIGLFAASFLDARRLANA